MTHADDKSTDKTKRNRDTLASDQAAAKERQDAKQANLALNEAFNEGQDEPVPAGAEQPGGLRGSPD